MLKKTTKKKMIMKANISSMTFPFLFFAGDGISYIHNRLHTVENQPGTLSARGPVVMWE